MPPLAPVTNVLRCDWLWTIGSDQNISTKLYFRYSGPAPVSSDCNAIAASIYTFASAMHAQWTPAVTLTGIKITDLSSPEGGLGEHQQATPGTRPAGALPAGTCVLTNYILARRYRGGKPRSYWPFFNNTDLTTPQTWFGTSITQLDSALATFFTSCKGVVVGSLSITDHVNVSYYSGNDAKIVDGWAVNKPIPRATPKVDAVVSFASSQQPSTQRRRN